MALKWTQENRFSARGVTGNFYKVFPFSNMNKYGASVSFLDENGNSVTQPVGTQYDTLEEAKEACEEAYTRAVKQT